MGCCMRLLIGGDKPCLQSSNELKTHEKQVDIVNKKVGFIFFLRGYYSLIQHKQGPRKLIRPGHG